MKFTETHEWISLVGDIGTVGITAYAEKELGDIVYVELPEVGKEIQAREEAVVLESTKAAVDVYCPVSGKIVELNQELKSDSGLINTSPEKSGWLFKVKLKDHSEYEELMDKQAYEEMVN